MSSASPRESLPTFFTLRSAPAARARFFVVWMGIVFPGDP
jgi:hypothetical protein